MILRLKNNLVSESIVVSVYNIIIFLICISEIEYITVEINQAIINECQTNYVINIKYPKDNKPKVYFVNYNK